MAETNKQGQGRNKVISRLGQPKKSDVPGGAGGGMGEEKFDWRIIFEIC